MNPTDTEFEAAMTRLLPQNLDPAEVFEAANRLATAHEELAAAREACNEAERAFRLAVATVEGAERVARRAEAHARRVLDGNRA